MAQKPMFIGEDNIIQAYDAMRGEAVCWSLWSGPRKYTQYCGDDESEARQMLQTVLQGGEQSNNTDVLCICIHPKGDEVYDKKSKVLATLVVRICPIGNEGQTVGGIGREYDEYRLPQPVYGLMKELRETLPGITTRLAALEAGNTKDPDTWDRIGGLLEKPGVPELIAQVAGPLVQQVMGFLTNMTPPPNLQVAGTTPARSAIAKNSDVITTGSIAEKQDVGHGSESPANIADNSDTAVDEWPFDDEQSNVIDADLLRLSKHCDILTDLGLLADLAENNPSMFAMMLGSLRGQ